PTDGDEGMSSLSQPLGRESGGSSVLLGSPPLVGGGVVAGSVAPAGVDDPQPGAGEDPHRVRVSFTLFTRGFVDVSGPGRVVSGVVGPADQGLARSFVGGVAEHDGAGLARGAGDGHDAGL